MANLMFFFVENPLQTQAAATWEVSASTRRLSPMDFFNRPSAPLPPKCIAFGNVGEIFREPISWKDGMLPGWEAFDPVGKWFADLQMSHETSEGYNLLAFFQVYSLRKIMTVSPQRLLPRKTMGVLGAGEISKLTDRIMQLAGQQFAAAKPSYEMLGLCNPADAVCQKLWACIVRRASIASEGFYKNDMNHKDSCSDHCGMESNGAYKISQHSELASKWQLVRAKLENVMEIAVKRGIVYQAAEKTPGCNGSDGGSSWDQMGSNLGLAATVLVAGIDEGLSCEPARRLHQTSAENVSTWYDSSEPAAISTLKMAMRGINASKHLQIEGSDLESSTNRSKAWYEHHPALAVLHVTAQSGLWAAAKLIFQPNGVLEQAMPKPQTKRRSERSRLHSERRTSSKAAGSANRSSFLPPAETAGEGAAARRLNVDCHSFRTACDCASAPHQCAWERWQEGEHDHAPWNEECMPGDDVESEWRLSSTSCYECPTQEGCQLDQIWANTAQVLEVMVPKVRKFSSEEDMRDFITGDKYGQVHMENGIPTSDEICMAINLEDASCIGGGGDCSYSLRYNASMATGRSEGAGKTEILEVLRTSGWKDEGDYDGFNIAKFAWMEYFEGFLRMQYVVDDFLLRPNAAADEVLPGQWYEFVPFPRTEIVNWNSDVRMGFAGRSDASMAYGSLGFIAFSSIVLAFAVVSRALREKEDQLRDGMRMMGLSDTAYYLSMYIWAVTWFIVPCTLMTIILQLTPTKMCPGGSNCELAIADLFRHTDFFWIWLILFLACLAQLSLGMILVPLVGRARTGRILAPAMMYFLTYVNFADPTTVSAKTAVGLVPGLALLQGNKVWIQLEDFGIGLKSSTMNVVINEYKFSASLIMLTVDIFLYFFIYWFFDQTATYGSGHRPIYFLCTAEFWKECLGRSHGSANLTDVQDSVSGGAFEAPSAACQEMTKEGKTLEVRGLRKTFKAQGRTIAAVDGVDFSMYPGEIYVLLGHNGAGKTTSISCLTGLIRPSSGQAQLFGQNLFKVLQTTEGRKQVGICPQHNVLWKELTCLEHVTLFGAFRGLKSSVARASGVDILSQCGLGDKASARGGALSGGMKRKLCLALSLVGDPKLCFLDEPSSGMDPTARRDTWDLLRRQKEGRIVVLTTHYMDEADVLADRIGIMSKGQLQCLGSPIFLKQYYGCGYNLNFELLEGVEKQDTINFVKQEIGDVADVKILSEAGSELVLLVDFSASRVFASLFSKLDNKATKKELGLNAWSIAVCHLEEVFLRVAAGNDVDMKSPGPSTVGKTTAAIEVGADGPQKPAEDVEQAGDVTVALRPSAPRQIVVMLKKRARYTVRDPMLCFCQLFCPMVALGVILAVMMSFIKDKAKLELSLDLYNDVAADSGAVRNVVPYSALRASMGQLPKELISMGLVGEAPKLELKPGGQCSATYNHGNRGWEDWGDDSYLESCMPTGAMGRQIGSSNLAAYARSLGCALLESEGDQMAARYVASLPVAADASGRANMVLMANLSAVHIAPIATNLASNMLRKKAGKGGKVNIASHPLPITASERKAFFGGDGLLITLAILVPAFIFPFPTAFSAAYVIREKETRVKEQHFMSGVELVTYWTGSILADYFIFVVAILLVLIPSAIAGVDAMISPEVVLAFFVFASAQIPFGYLIGSFFSTAAGAQNFVLAFNMGVTFIFSTAGFILRSLHLCWQPKIEEASGQTCTMGLNDWLDIILRCIPGVCLSECMHVIGTVNALLKVNPVSTRTAEWYAECEENVKYYESPHWSCVDSPLAFGAAGGPLLWLGIEAVCFIIIILLVDSLQLQPYLRQMMQYRAPPVRKPEGWEDQDVINEENVMESVKQAAVHCRAIRKVYGPLGLMRLMRPCLNRCRRCCCSTCVCSCCQQEETHAVKGVSFALKYGEVFGLLGTNGAGKSSVFNMVAGHLSPTSGVIHVNGLHMGTGVGARTARKITGYCPQENALLDMMTTREHLVFYSNLKGVPGNQIGTVADAKMEQLGLAVHAKTYAANLSGGNKRKLMVACALIGDPNVILADEPSAGMDPVARRFMWSVIQNVASRRKRSSVLLSTHSMEECEALCNRSAIMVNGVFRCIGSNRAIRERYGGGFELMVKVRPPTDEELQQVLTAWNHPPDARLHSSWATQAAGENAFFAAAVSGPSSPFADNNALITPKVLAEWWLFTARFQTLHAFVPTMCNTVELLEWHGPMAKYKLTTYQGLGDLFAKMEANRELLQITEYSLSATTLEQIFNSFARHQETQDKTPLLVGQPVLERQTSGTDYLTSFVHLATQSNQAALQQQNQASVEQPDNVVAVEEKTNEALAL